MAPAAAAAFLAEPPTALSNFFQLELIVQQAVQTTVTAVVDVE